MKNNTNRNIEPTLFFEDLIAQPEKPIKFRLLSSVKALREDERALICLVPDINNMDAEDFYISKLFSA